ncbi:DMT family transporter [Reinekea marinisedimentorum]|uniref:Drug/metabolite transporter (DMT)-like permease n=1 Tax=Reinekea marinisedimentorum TaxID=230495 RepID=A0A4R3I3D2_9GAMM|nr:DMT family transporter [Reinekea marinisedimentorum]TCS40324.1 drug/metabolite transporter (DMT)-like permease [Reinekea marinisedimentorum]
MKSEQKALIFALLAVLLWSTVATAFKVALQYHSVISLLTGAAVVSLLTLTALLAQQKKLSTALTTLPAHWKQRLLLGSINPLIYYLILFECYRRLPAQVAQPINYTWAITLALLSIPVLKQKLRIGAFVGLLIGYGGVVVISLAGKNVTGSLDMFGIALALISTLFWAGYWLLNTRNKQDPMIGLFQNFLIATPMLFIVLMLFNHQPLDWSLPAIASVTYIGLFEMGITFVFWQLALQHTSNTARIGSLIFLSPFISLFLIHLVLGEPLQLQTFFGLGLIIFGVVIAQRSRG